MQLYAMAAMVICLGHRTCLSSSLFCRRIFSIPLFSTVYSYFSYLEPTLVVHLPSLPTMSRCALTAPNPNQEQHWTNPILCEETRLS
jgi:hypothetical protein